MPQERRALFLPVEAKGLPWACPGALEAANEVASFFRTQGWPDYELDVCRNPTGDKIVRELQRFKWFARMHAGAAYYTVFVGRGTQRPDVTGDEADLRDEAVLGCDGDLVTDDEMTEILRTLPAHTTLVFFFDCDHSGTILDLPWLWQGPDAPATSVPGCPPLSPRVLLLSASADGEKGVQPGTFLRTFWEVARTHDRDTPVAELFAETRRRLMDLGITTEPQLSASHPDLFHAPLPGFWN